MENSYNQNNYQYPLNNQRYPQAHTYYSPQAQYQNWTTPEYDTMREHKKNSADLLGILGIIFAVFLPLVGLIMGFVTNTREKELKALNVNQRFLGKIAIAIAVVRIVFTTIIFGLMLLPSLGGNY